MRIFDDARVFLLKAGLAKPLQWGLLAGLLTALATLFMPNHYRSEAKLLPVDSKVGGGNMAGLASAAAAFGVNVPGSDGFDANFADVLNSRPLKEQLIRAEYSYQVKSWYLGTEKMVKGTLYGYLDARNMDQAVKTLGRFYSASRDPKSKVITLGVETKSPELSQQVVQQAIKALEQFNQEKGRTRGGAKAAFADARLAESRREMDAAEDAFRNFLGANRNYLGSADPSVRLKGSRLETELKLRQQLLTTLALNREQALLEEKNDIPILNILDAGNLPIEKSGPARSLICLGVLIFVTGLWWIASNWGFIRDLLWQGGPDSASPTPAGAK